MTAISYSIGCTAIDAAVTTVTVAPPPAYASGDLLVIGIIAGGTSNTVVTASTPSGWTKLSGSSAPGVFTKTATGSEPGSYSFTLSAASTAAVFCAAYPAGTVASSAFHASGSDVTGYTPAFPSGVTSSQTVLLVAGAVAYDGDVNANSGYQNVSLPSGSGWTTEVPVFGPALPDNTGSVFPVAIGLADVAGSAAAQALTSPQGCNIYAGYVVLNITGTSTPQSVTATVAYPEGTPGMALTVKALSGAAAPAVILAGGATELFYASGTSQAPAAAITPRASGSYVYGAVTENYGVTGGTSYTAATGTTFSQNVPDATWDAIYGTLRSASATTPGTPVTLGGSAPDNAYATAALAEILHAAGSSLAETATATASGILPGQFATTAVAQTAVFPAAPAPGTLLVAMVSANSLFGNGSATVTVADSLGLTWIPLAEVHYPSYSGVWIAGGPVAANQILDEAGYPVFDEAGAGVCDETGFSPAPSGGKAHQGRRSARAGSGRGSRGAAYVYVPVVPAVFSLPHRAAERHPSARKGAAKSGRGAKYVYVEIFPAPFTLPVRAVQPHPSARRGTSQGQQGAPYTAVSPYPGYYILDESGSPVLDEGGGNVEDESGPYPEPGSTSWQAARAGMPGDYGAVNFPDQASQFLYSHGTVPVYAGNRIWTSAVPSPTAEGAFGWLASGTPGWLPAYDVSQPFAMPSGSTAVGRVQVPVQASGSGADLQVTLCADNGSGIPNLASPLASVTIPASHILAQSASGSLAGAGPLATARYNTSLIGSYAEGPWAQPSVSSNGAGSFASPATSGNYTALVGGYDSTAAAAAGYVATIAYQGGSVSGGATQPSLPQPAYYHAVTLTADSVVVTGGRNTTTEFLTVWTAPYTPGTGTVGAWSSQQGLPYANVYGASASWGTQVYVIGGSPTGAAAGAQPYVWTASSTSGQITHWAACPSLPQPVVQAYAAVVGNWLIVAGGVSAAGVSVTTTWYSAINADGSLAGWQQGPSLPQACSAFAPGWNLAVTDSAVIIVSGQAQPGSSSQYAQVLSVSPDGPGDAWTVQNWVGSVSGYFQVGVYQSGASGQWQVFNLHLAGYDYATLGPVPMVSVPLPASGLTPGATYHVVLHQSGGNLNSSLAAGVLGSGAGTHLLTSPAGAAAWTQQPGIQVAVNVLDKTPGGPVLHLTEDGGDRVTSPVYYGGSGLLAGVMEGVVFPAGSPEAALGTVTQIEWTGGYPTGLVNLA